KADSGKRVGTKVRGIGVAVSPYSGGSTGFDGLLIIKPDGRVQIQSGIGNLGTESVFDVHRVAADILGVPFEQCDIVWGSTTKNLPWTCVSAGSQTTHAMPRAGQGVGNAAVRMIQEGAAKTHGGNAAASKVETGKYFVTDYLVVADVGTVINPRTLHGQALGGSMMGIGHAISQKWVYDQHYGVPLAKRFYYNKPLTILDAPAKMSADAVGLP